MNFENILTKQQALKNLKELSLSFENLKAILEVERKERDRIILDLECKRFSIGIWTIDKIKEMCRKKFKKSQYMKFFKILDLIVNDYLTIKD